MQLLHPSGSAWCSAVMVPWDFIDRYMPAANGEFIKIFLYLLRHMESSKEKLSLSSMADVFECREADVKRALLYWERMGFLKFEPGDELYAPVPMPGNTSETAPETKTAKGREAKKTLPPSKTISSDRQKELCQEQDFQDLLFVAERYFSKTLSTSEIRTVMYFHDRLGMSYDLIHYLFEYAVSRNKKSFHYLEAVALAWTEEGITSRDQAMDMTAFHKSRYYSVLKAMGIRDRDPVADETAAIDRWRDQWGFTQDIILEACRRTLSLTGKASFPYANSILESWHAKGIHSLEDINQSDLNYQKKKTDTQQTSRRPSKKQNQFNNFQQRSYDYTSIEDQLLNKSY